MNMTTCWMALDETRADTGTIYYARGSHLWERLPAGGQFHDPDDWTGYMSEVARPSGSPRWSGCRSRCRPAERRSTTAGRGTGRRRASVPIASGGR